MDVETGKHRNPLLKIKNKINLILPFSSVNEQCNISAKSKHFLFVVTLR